jgi:hypothetical protein
MNAVLHWEGRRNRSTSIVDEGARLHGVHYRVSAAPLPLPPSFSASADNLSLGTFIHSAAGRDAAHVACQKHANRRGKYLEGAGLGLRAANDPALVKKRLRATHAALTLVRSSLVPART